MGLCKDQRYVFRGKMGIFGFFDDGRVWLENDNSINSIRPMAAGFLPAL